MLADKIFDIQAGTQVQFNSDITIKGKLYVRAFIDKVGEGDWSIIDESEYTVINDSLVFNEPQQGVYLAIQVATVSSELTQTPTENTILLSIKDEILQVASISGDIVQAPQILKDTEDARDLAERWATELEDVEVQSGKYSAYHWALKAEELAQGSASNISTVHDNNTLTGTNVQEDIDELDSKTESNIEAIQTNTNNIQTNTSNIQSNTEAIENLPIRYDIAKNTIQDMSSVSIDNYIDIKGFGVYTYTGQTNSINGAYYTGGAGEFDYTVDILRAGDFFWNNTGSAQTITVYDAFNLLTKSIIVADQNGYLNTCIDSVDFTVANNGSGYWLDRTTKELKNDAGVVQDLSTPIAFDWGTNKGVSKVHIKERNSTDYHQVVDGLRGVGRFISTNSTQTESVYTSNSLTSFESNGFGLLSGSGVNQSGQTYVAYQTLYTHGKASLTSQGKLQIEMYKPVTREGMIYYIGSGIAGHQISHSMGVEIDFFEVKNLNSALDWSVTIGGLAENGDYLKQNTTDEIISGSTSSTHNILNNELGAGTLMNKADEENIAYYKCKSENWTIVEYQGTGASGNFVETKDVYGNARKPRRVIIKRIDSTGNWVIVDTERPNGVNYKELYLNLSDAEFATSTRHTIYSNGFTINTADSVLNASGGQYIALVEFDTNAVDGSPDDSYFKYVTDDSNLNLTASIFNFTNGKDINGFNVTSEEITGTLDFSGVSDGLKYPIRTKETGWRFEDKPLSVGMYNKESDDDNRLVFDVDTGKVYETTGGELVTNGTFDVDTSGWTAENGAIISSDNGTLYFSASSTDNARAYQNTITTIGDIYTLSLDFLGGTLDSGWVDIDDTNVMLIANTEIGTYTYTFIATDTTTKISVGKGTNDSATMRFDNISVYKVQPDLGTEVGTEVSFFKYPIMVQSETPQYIAYDQEEVLSNVMESTEFQGFVKLKENRKVIELGTIFNDNRYVIDNPFGNEKYKDCDVRCEIYSDTLLKWVCIEGTIEHSGTFYGVRSFSTIDGIILKTATNYLTSSNDSSFPISYDVNANLTSAPARVIVTYQGETK